MIAGMEFDKQKQRAYRWQIFISLAIIVLLVLFLPIINLAQHPGNIKETTYHYSPRFMRYSVHDGLPSNVIKHIFQDSRGFLWMATPEGLSCFDGKNFNSYKPTDYDGKSFTSDNIDKILEDKYNNLIFNTNNGVCKLDWKTKNIKIALSDTNRNIKNRICDLLVDKYYNIWLLTNSGLEKYDSTFHIVKTYDLSWIKNKKATISTNLIFQDRKNNIWFTYNGLLNYININTGKINNTIAGSDYPIVINKYPEYIAEDSQGNLWFNARDTLYCYDVKNKNLSHFVNIGHTMREFKILNTGEIWISSWGNGTFIFNAINKQFHQIRNIDCNQNSPSSNLINYIYEDHEGLVWLGSDHGLDKCTNTYNNFFTVDQFGLSYTENVTNKVILNKPELCGEIIYIPTTYGQFAFNTTTLELINYHKSKITYSITDYYWANLKYGNNQVLATHWPGLSVFDINKKSLQPHSLNIKVPAYLDTIPIVSLYSDTKNNIWFSLINDGGIIKWNTSDNTFKHFSLHDTGINHTDLRHFTACAEDDNGNIFMGYDKGGIQVFHPDKQYFTGLPVPVSDQINKDVFHTLLNDHHGNMWMTTSSGLIKYSLATNTYHRYTKYDGLPSTLINGMAMDNHSRLWLATMNGISCLEINREIFTNYNLEHGIPEQSTFHVLFDYTTNHIYFTTGSTLCFFNPDKLTSNSNTLHPIITSFKVNGKEREYVPNKILRINNDENSFSFTYATPNFTNPLNTRYAYQLSGYDDKWVVAGTRQYTSYNNLPGGSYTFRLMASSDGIHWSQMDNPINIYVAIPFTKTKEFVVLITFLILCCSFIVVFIIYRTRINRLILTQKIRSNIASDLHDDIGSSLSSIMLMGELARQQPNKTSKYLEEITQTSVRTLENMNDIIWSVNPLNDTMEEMSVRMKTFAFSLLEKKDITLDFELENNLNDLKLKMEDRKNLYLIFKEAIHNAFKYANCTNVRVEFTRTGHELTMIIKDDGKGFNISNPSSGNGLYNMRKRAGQINSQLQIISESGSGTTIVLIIKTTRLGIKNYPFG